MRAHVLLGLAITVIFALAPACGDDGTGGYGGGGGTTTSTGNGGATTSSTTSGTGGATTSSTTSGTGGATTTSTTSGTGGATTSTTSTGGGTCDGVPTGGLYATFDVAGDTFRVSITSDTSIQQAIDLWTGAATTPDVPTGNVVCTSELWNCGWSFVLDPASVTFAATADTSCDTKPSVVEASCSTFTTLCPSIAKLVELRDCRTDPTCPVMAM